MKDKYTLGKCKSCKENKALKNGYCVNCQTDYNLKDLFNFLGINHYDYKKNKTT